MFLDDVTVSRACIRAKGAVVRPRRGSLNGTYVNGEQVDETKLATGDQVQIGRFEADVLPGRG